MINYAPEDINDHSVAAVIITEFTGTEITRNYKYTSRSGNYRFNWEIYDAQQKTNDEDDDNDGFSAPCLPSPRKFVWILRHPEMR